MLPAPLAGGVGATSAPTGVQGQCPGGGPGGKAPGSYRVFGDSNCLLTCLVAPFVMSQQIVVIVIILIYLLNQLYR